MFGLKILHRSAVKPQLALCKEVERTGQILSITVGEGAREVVVCPLSQLSLIHHRYISIPLLPFITFILIDWFPFTVV